MTEYQIPEERDIEVVLSALKLSDAGSPDYPTILYGLSDLSPTDLQRIIPVWDSLSATQRRILMKQMLELSETDFTMDYQAIGLHSLNDPDPQVRAAAVETLWTDDSLNTMDRFISMAQNDEAEEVRAVAASALGHYILLGELGELPESQTTRAQDAAITLWQDPNEPVEVRRRALEAISNCGHALVPEAIQEAYRSGDTLMQVSAIFAMGRTYDARWQEIVLRELKNSEPQIRFEAARTAGELELRDAVPGLGQLAIEDDVEIRDVAVWALGEIGSREALRILEQLAEDAYHAQDEALSEVIEDAIAAASLMGGDLPFMFELDQDTDDDLWDENEDELLDG